MSDLVWVFSPDPQGREDWQWPIAVYNGPAQKMAACILCEKPYNPLDVKLGMHPQLGVVLFRYNMGESVDPNNKGRRMLCDLRFTRLRIAIKFDEDFLSKNSDWKPRII